MEVKSSRNERIESRKRRRSVSSEREGRSVKRRLESEERSSKGKRSRVEGKNESTRRSEGGRRSHNERRQRDGSRHSGSPPEDSTLRKGGRRLEKSKEDYDGGRRERKLAVERQIYGMLSTEKHHTRRIDRFTSGEIDCVYWCPQYISPDVRGHVRGGTSLLHHRCRHCRKICFHLLGQPGTTRLCLACSGYKEKYIPKWYYHDRCKYC